MKTTTFREQGLSLPIGRVVNGALVKDLAFRQPTAKTDRLLNIWREQNKGQHIAHEVCKYLSLVVSQAAGESYALEPDGDSSSETASRFLAWPYGDVMYAYMYARVSLVSEWMEVGYVCPTCMHIDTLEVDLWEHTVDVLEDPDDLRCDVKLVDGIRLSSGKRCTGFSLKPTPFLAMTMPGALAETTDALGYNQLRESISKVIGDDDYILTNDELDSMTKRDFLRLDRQSGKTTAGPRMRTPIECRGKNSAGKRCSAKLLNAIDWTYDHFFDSSIPPKRLTI